MAALLGSFGAKSSASQAKFGSSKMLNPNFRREAENIFHLNIQNLTKSGPLDKKRLILGRDKVGCVSLLNLFLLCPFV